MDTAEIRTPSQEPVQQLATSDNEAHREGQQAPNAVDDTLAEQRRIATQAPLPFWLAEKFHWHTSESGFVRLRPNENFLAAVQADAPKFEQYGYKLVHPEGGSGAVEHDLVESLKVELDAVLTSMRALHEREEADFLRWLSDRVTRNCVYAAITQFEIDEWTARSQARGQDASEHQNFGEKQSRRDTFAITGAVFGEVLREINPQANLSDATFEKTARSVIYQQADMRGREQLNPQQVDQQEQASIAAAVVANRPF